MELSYVQLSHDTHVDNDAVNLTPHQIAELQRIAGTNGFGGMVSPDLNRSRPRGPMVVSWFHNGTQRFMYLGLYRTLPWPQEAQIMELNKRKHGFDFKRAMQLTMLRFSFPQGNNQDEVIALLEPKLQKLQETLKALPEDDEQRLELSKDVHHLARQLVVFANWLSTDIVLKEYDR